MSVLFHKTIIAHRGAAAYAPENTMPAFYKAIEIGSSWIEFDVRLTKCGTVVVFHDSHLGRVSSVSGKLNDFTYKYLQNLDVGSRFSAEFFNAHIPTLNEVLRKLESLPVSLNIELKSGNHDDQILVESVISLLSTHCAHWKNSILISSNKLRMLQWVRQYSPDIPLAYVAHHWQKNILSHLEELNFVAYGMSRRHVNKKRIDLIHDKGMQVLVYTVNTADEAQELFSYGVDAVFSDYPDLVSSSYDTSNEVNLNKEI